MFLERAIIRPTEEFFNTIDPKQTLALSGEITALASNVVQQLNGLLPSGLHDAELRSFSMDYTTRQLTLDVEAWIDQDAARNLYRPARITFGDVGFIFVEPPRNQTELDVATSVRIDAGILKEHDERLVGLDARGPITYLFLTDFNSFIFFSADSVAVEWSGPEEARS